jgi:hypothetical protein
MFDAVLFLGGAILFLLAVVFFVVLWQQRVEVEDRERTIEQMEAEMREQRVDLEILERELSVWEKGLVQEQKMLEDAREELRMLTAVKQPGGGGADFNAETASDLALSSRQRQASSDSKDRHTEGRRYLIKNVKPSEEQELD